MPQGVVELLARRGFLILTLSFSLVLLGGVAMAAVGVFGGDDTGEPVTALSAFTSKNSTPWCVMNYPS